MLPASWMFSRMTITSGEICLPNSITLANCSRTVRIRASVSREMSTSGRSVIRSIRTV